jgi:hypothetical protein
MSLWSFQGARGLLRTTRGCRHPSCNSRTDPVSQNSTAYVNRIVEVNVLLGELNYLTVVVTIKGFSAYRSKSSGFPRKEVIQPQLPLRLPCYDFTPIIDPTLDGSLPCGLGHRLRVLPTFVV